MERLCSGVTKSNAVGAADRRLYARHGGRRICLVVLVEERQVVDLHGIEEELALGELCQRPGELLVDRLCRMLPTMTAILCIARSPCAAGMPGRQLYLALGGPGRKSFRLRAARCCPQQRKPIKSRGRRETAKTPTISAYRPAFRRRSTDSAAWPVSS